METYYCKNCGALCFGEPAAVVKVGTVIIRLGICCASPQDPVTVEAGK
jgi:hypothetical protein